MRDVHDSTYCVIAARCPQARFTLTDVALPPTATTTVTIADCPIGRLHRGRLRLRRELLVLFYGGEDLAERETVVRRS